MDKKKLLMINLGEDNTKHIAKAITSDTCRKILNALADKEATASDLSKSLKLPLSTIHYNLSQLTTAGLVVAEEFHYSKKMKEIMHYKLANQFIIIAPKNAYTFSLKEKLKNLLPIVSLGAVFSLFVSFYEQLSLGISNMLSPFFSKTETMDFNAIMVEEAEPAAFAMRAVETQAVSEPNIGLWFFLGFVFAALVWLAFEYFKYRVKK